jgi:hypothetical protein
LTIDDKREQFFDDLLTKPLSFVVSKWIIDCSPHIFLNQPVECIMWKEKLSSLIGIDSRSIVITGSAGVGFSLNPSKNFRKYNANSDIDVAVISNHYFDISWHALRNLGTKRHGLPEELKASVQDHVKRLIYWGTIATDKILSILPFGKEWDEALTKMKSEPATQDREINIRIYKDFESLRAYNINNLNNLKNIVLEQRIGGAPSEKLLEHHA